MSTRKHPVATASLTTLINCSITELDGGVVERP